ncbi:hypothetical protein MYAM1_003211 [Malassezia yamatoensis]|uniref:SRP54-type proteins GTP-binding domain-containing protein n=1 Tax=Malassezia yamatoensis TaxID=253288 RepID=A0AAJ5YXC5_9BASI|nr:hypothetical protein MYAM1_003211 [Malassezia yamatoensis]
MIAGSILWSREFLPSVNERDVVNYVIRTAFFEERTAYQKLDFEGFTIRWSFSNKLDLVFLVSDILTKAVYQRILQLNYVDQLLEAVQGAFTKQYQPFLEALPTGKVSREALQSYAASLPNWTKQFLQLLRQSEQTESRRPVLGEKQENHLSDDPSNEQESLLATKSEPVRPGAKLVAKPGGKRVVSKAKKAKGGSSTPTKIEATPEPKKTTKERRKWGEDGQAIESDQDPSQLDFSTSGTQSDTSVNLTQWIDPTKLGKRTADGRYEIADEDQNTSAAHEDDSDDPPGFLANLRTKSSQFSLTRLMGGSQALTEADLQPVIYAMQVHLQSKNVANDVAALICDGVQRRLVGKRLTGFRGIKREVRQSLEESITRILTPSTSTDILLEIASKTQRRNELLSTLPNASRSTGKSVSPALNPYALCFVGVNGVGKSTNLAKVCFWLLQNRLRVMIAACDTFRSGAVEQLRTHVRNLGQLDIDGRRVADGNQQGEPRLELYERGYGKDAAGIAKDALAHARQHKYDVVLIDTAGRMQDNEPLMRALAKLIAVNTPDKVLFVGEALVGNEAVDQLTKFHRALKDYSGVSNPRGLDGCLLTKWDTVDDKVGTALTSTWATGLPIYFVGTGQTYTDLRQLRVHHVVNALLRE